MPSLSFFVDQHDVAFLLDRLNRDPEIAFIVPDGPVPPDRKRENQEVHSPITLLMSIRGFEVAGSEGSGHQHWKAVRTIGAIGDGHHSLWHVPAGPLPLIQVGGGSVAPGLGDTRCPPIPDPWTGWTGSASFGAGCQPWIRLEICTRHRPYTEEERRSLRELNAFWTDKDDRLVASGFQWTGGHFRPAPPQTLRWWNRMRGWLNRNAVQLSHGFWAFPSALHKLKGGMQYYSRNFELDDAIRRAEIPG